MDGSGNGSKKLLFGAGINGSVELTNENINLKNRLCYHMITIGIVLK